MTIEQAESLISYAEQFGDNWKSLLMQDWMRGGSKSFRGEWCYLQQLRNTVGPSGLKEITIGG